MKKYLILSVLVLTVTFQGFSGDRSEVWSRMYKRSFSPQLKYSVMLNIVELNDRGMIPLLEQILAEDIISNLANTRSITEERDFIELTKLIIRELGELKSKDSGSLVFTIIKEIDDPLLRAECIIALGNMRADAYLNDIVLQLRNINMRPVKGQSAELEAESIVAYASVIALDRFRNIEGYSPVFFASVGWYDQRVKFLADKVLKTIVENPIEALIPIISDGTFKEKEKAVFEVAACNAPAVDKARAARDAMKQGFDNVADSIQEGMVLTSIRKSAIKILYSSKSTDSEDVYYLSQSVKIGTDLEEKIYAIRTLGLNGSTEAIDALVSNLTFFNERSVNGLDISYADQDVIKEMIVTLGNTGNEKASAVLTEVQFSGYSKTIIKIAEEALGNIN